MAEILGGLALVMFAATAVLAALLTRHHESQQRERLARALTLEAAAAPGAPGLVPGARWWRVDGEGGVRPRPPGSAALDAASADLARRAREAGAPVLASGTPWGEVRFAIPVGSDGTVAVARLPASGLPGGGAAPRLVALAILVADAAIFIAFGASLLRRRVVLPLRRLAASARALADGATDVRAPLDGTRETAEVAQAFNEMTEALATRTEDLEKAVSELRQTNRELREAQAGLARAERLAAVGQLAAGVAHEVGNPMGALLAFLDLAGRDAGLSDASRSHLVRAAAQVERVRRILRQMLDFSRPERRSAVPFDLAAVAEETAALLRAQAGRSGAVVETVREGVLPLALGDPAAAAQILLNLGLNAVHAAGQSGSPRVCFRLQPAVLRRRAGSPGDGPDAGRRRPDAVACTVEDNGGGVAAEHRERIFDPFFTTKDPGQGTGLGLASAARLAGVLGGTLELLPGEGGARFALRLPAAGSEADCGVRTPLRSREGPARPERDPDPQG